MYGQGKHYTKVNCERLMRQLVVTGVLKEELSIGSHEQAVCYVKLGKLATDVLQNKHKVRHTEIGYT